MVRFLRKEIVRMYLMIKSLKKIYKHGGYTTINITSVNYGEILKGKKILLTGGGSGIGLSIAKKCLQEGAMVVITGRNEDKLTKALEVVKNPMLKTLVWDISQVSRIEENIEKSKDLLDGEIDILVNNAGIVIYNDFPNVTEEDWDSTYSINSKGLFFLTQSLCTQWLKQEKSKLKKIINISSRAGFVGATRPYRMSKWDVAGLTQGLGVKLAPHNIIVNGIAPGVVQIDRDGIAPHRQPYLRGMKENVYARVNPLERVAIPEEIAELAIFLMSDACNFIVGQTIVCDGGSSIKC